jgi:GGDEF domain-containing protein
VLRRLIGRLFGFEQELEELRGQVRELSWDDTFGMWTRGAFLQFCQVMPRGQRLVIFMDLNDIHDLNEQLGYSEVDRRVKATFSVPFRRSDVVARWYSGDEIVILFDAGRGGAACKLEQLQQSATDQGLSFFWTLGDWDVGKEPIEDVVARLASEVTAAKIMAHRDALASQTEDPT